MKKYYCNYCCEWIECKNGKSFGGHKSNCKDNPIREEKNKKISEANKRNHPKKAYKLICKKCKKQYTIEMTEYVYGNNKYRKHCSRKCANSHVQSLTQNNARRKKLLGRNTHVVVFITRECKICKTLFVVRKGNDRKCCTRSCSVKYAMYVAQKRRNLSWSEIHLKSFKNGRKPTGKYYVEWFTYGHIKVQGTYELRTCYILDAMKEMGEITDWKYTFDRFPYIGFDGREHSYFPDFKVFGNDTYYIEVKGLLNDIDKVKWKSVRDNEYRLEVWDLDVIKNNESCYGITTCP